MFNRPWLIACVALILLTVVMIVSLVLPPPDFPTNLVVEIPAGSSTSQIADLLRQNRIIRSSKLFELLALRQEVAERLRAGFYQFEKPLTIRQVLSRLEDGLFANNLIKLTVPEGFSIGQLTALAEENFSQIEKDSFIKAASTSAGRLFPDTYLLPPELTAEQLVVLMRENFDKQIDKFKTDFEASGRSVTEVIKMASLVEEEAKTEVDRRIIAGILWKRLDKGMRLEVDVATSTYERLGLPDEPIVSPGLESLEATLNPTATSYWFYLSDKKGTMYYAKTFAEHKLNIDKYLK